jgi:hypothetical protein
VLLCAAGCETVLVDKFANGFGDAGAQLSGCVEFNSDIAQLVDQFALVMILHRVVARRRWDIGISGHARSVVMVLISGVPMIVKRRSLSMLRIAPKAALVA